MKKVIAISSLVAASIVYSGQAQARKGSTEENVGFATGAIAGAAVGGPVGFIVGGVAGLFMGDQVHQANQLEDVQAQLQETATREQQLKQEIAMIQETLEFEKQSAQDTGWVANGLTLNVMFTTNSANLSDADQNNVAKIADIMKRFPELSLRLQGYSDPRGSKKDNLSLSQRRVDSVIAAFETKGIDQTRLLGIAHGEVEIQPESQDMDSFAMARKVSVDFITESEAGSLAQN